MWRLDVSAQAEVEIFEAALRYEREKSGLGFRFEADLGRVFTRLAENPLQFPEIESEARRALLRRFPYGVFFTTAGHAVIVLAVLHLHRHPDTYEGSPSRMNEGGSSAFADEPVAEIVPNSQPFSSVFVLLPCSSWLFVPWRSLPEGGVRT